MERLRGLEGLPRKHKEYLMKYLVGSVSILGSFLLYIILTENKPDNRKVLSTEEIYQVHKIGDLLGVSKLEEKIGNPVLYELEREAPFGIHLQDSDDKLHTEPEIWVKIKNGDVLAYRGQCRFSEYGKYTWNNDTKKYDFHRFGASTKEQSKPNF